MESAVCVRAAAVVSNADYGAGWSIMLASLVGGGQRRAWGGEAVEQLALLPLFLVVALASLVWPVFLLRRGLRQGKALPAPKYRHLMTYYDNRFAQDMGLLFCLVNTRMRHEVATLAIEPSSSSRKRSTTRTSKTC